MKTQLQSIGIELAECQNAWAKNPDAKLAWCCHHEILIEPLTESAENRIEYILSYKPENQQAARFRSFRPVRIKLPAEYEKAVVEFEKVWTEYIKASAEFNKAWAEWNKAITESYKVYVNHKSELELLLNQDWPNNTWNGNTVFG